MSADNSQGRTKPGLLVRLHDALGYFGFAVAISAAMAFSVGLLIGCHSAPELTSQEIAGKHLYVIRCAHCHEENDLVLRKIPPNLHSVFKDATLPSGVPATDSDVRRVVLAGRGLMPGFDGRFTDEQMAALLAYLHTGLR